MWELVLLSLVLTLKSLNVSGSLNRAHCLFIVLFSSACNFTRFTNNFLLKRVDISVNFQWPQCISLNWAKPMGLFKVSLI